MFDAASPRSPRSARPGSARPVMSPRRPTSAMGTRPSSASPAELCDRYIRDMQSMEALAAKGEVKMGDINAYSFWELHKLTTQSRSIQRQEEWARKMEAKRAAGPGSKSDWYVLTGSPRPNLRSQHWLNDDLRSNLGGPPYFPAPELGELQPFSTYKWDSSNRPRSRPQTPQARTPQGSRPSTPRETARPSVGFSDAPITMSMSKADWVERANAMMTDTDRAEMQEAVTAVENQIAARFRKMRLELGLGSAFGLASPNPNPYPTHHLNPNQRRVQDARRRPERHDQSLRAQARPQALEPARGGRRHGRGPDRQPHGGVRCYPKPQPAARALSLSLTPNQVRSAQRADPSPSPSPSCSP
jgi:hypothetical protein